MHGRTRPYLFVCVLAGWLTHPAAVWSQVVSESGENGQLSGSGEDGQLFGYGEHVMNVADINPDPTVFESDQLPETMRYMASVGNGHLATNIFSDTVYVNSLYSGRLGNSHRARVPSYHSSNISVQGEPPVADRYILDTNRGVFEHVHVTSSANVTYRVYAHQFYDRLLITEVTVTRTSGQQDVVASLESLSGSFDSVDLILGPADSYTSVTSGCDVAGQITCSKRSGTISLTETDTSPQTPVYIYWRDPPATLTLPGTSSEQTWTYVLSLDLQDAVARANFDAGMEFVKNQNQSALLTNHETAWADIWSRGNIELDGDISIATLQKVVRGSLYYLYSNLPSQSTFSISNQFSGLSPGGLANGARGTDYYGHVFWDMETWMYPIMLLLRPDLAKAMLSYRMYAMEPAFGRAASGGHEGTRFPWESAYTGEEVTPNVCVPCRENQQHITSDIAFAARQYVSATRDVTWLTSQGNQANNYTGFDFVHNMARFWFTRPTYNSTKDRNEINGVMPPDEHQQSINNSVYTNVGASLAVHFARYASCLAGRDPLQDVPDSWITTVQELYFPFHQDRRYHEEYEGYEDDVINNITHQSFVKQADVVLLGYPFLWDMPADVRRNDLLEYENVTSPGGPAMTWGMFATGWLDVGDNVKAAAMFDKSYQLYYREPFKVWTEAQQGAGAVNFITGQGGFLQALVSGYGGLRLHVEELQFRQPQLPPGVTDLHVRSLSYLGSELDLHVTSSDVTLTSMSEGALPLELHLADGSSLPLTAGTPRTFALQNFSVNTTVSTGCPLPLDNIEVDYGTPL